MHFSTAFIALAAASLANGHMLMASPKPYTSPVIDNSPLLPDGSNFPCKAPPGTKYAGDNINMPIGSSQSLTFTGSAVHGGGSCQISVTYVSPPPKDPSQWSVIYSIEGGCPAKGVAGNLPADPNGSGAGVYSFKIPEGVKTNTPATLAWTWFNKIGNREMYMNCAPVTFTGGSSKRDTYDNATMLEERDTSFPPMFTANIGNGCTTVESVDTVFPNPGAALDKFGVPSALGPPTGTCGSGSAAAAAPPAGSSSPSVSAAAPSGASSAPPVAAVSPATTMATQAAPSSSAAPSSAAAVVPAPAPVPATGGASGAQTPQSPCTSEGMWNCLPDGKSFQQCGSGMWSAVQQLAAGMKCAPGQSMTFSQSAAKVRRSRVHGNIHHRQGSVL